VTAERDRVVVLYSHPLLGEGLGRMLAAEPDMAVTTVSLDTMDALDAALAASPDVVVFEEGGPIGILEVLRRSGATVVVDVDITSSTAWTLRRQSMRSDPEEVLGAIRDALKLGRPAPPPVPEREPARPVGPGRAILGKARVGVKG
jgi:DNA-binding NarL/FixJ family response regulator